MSRLKSLVKRILFWRRTPDYREALFEDLCAHLHGTKPGRILEIGPKDGQDTRRLLGLEPDTLTLIDLPRMKDHNAEWLRQMDSSRIHYISANLMYGEVVNTLGAFDCVWCTGVLYHNPEQLRMIKRLYDLLKPGGVLVLESATIRRWTLRHANCVEILYPPSERIVKKYHLSKNITHLPSMHAIASWLEMVGFRNIVRSQCHRKVSAALARHRAAFLCVKPLQPQPGRYYTLDGEEGFVIGGTL